MRYFIFDTGVTLSKPDYTHTIRNLNNISGLKEGLIKCERGINLFIESLLKYRRINNLFFWNWYCWRNHKIGEDKFGKDNVICKVIEPVRFENLVFQTDDALLNYDWKWKKRIKRIDGVSSLTIME